MQRVNPNDNIHCYADQVVGITDVEPEPAQKLTPHAESAAHLISKENKLELICAQIDRTKPNIGAESTAPDTS